MWSEKSFQEILREKIKEDVATTETAREHSSSARIAGDPMEYWQISRPTPRLKLTCHVGYEVKPPPKSSVQWSPRQIEILKELIELGAVIEIDSPYRQIKRAYRQLLIKYHPDHSQQADEFTIQRNSRLLQQAIKAFREFDSARSTMAA